ncbi:unnamed protein product [Caenorhabditis nigoni]
MPFAYDWLTKPRNTNIKKIIFHTFNDKIEFHLHCNLGGRILETIKIIYKRNGSFTLITFEQNELVVPQHFLDVFLEDLKIVLMNQKIVVSVFYVSLGGIGMNDAKCALGLEEILRTRTSALAVKDIRFTQITVSQGMSIIPYLNSKELTHLSFFPPSEPVSFEDLLNGFRNLENGYEFKLYVEVKTIDIDDLIAINEFASFLEIIRDLDISFKFLRHPDECRSILSDVFELQDRRILISKFKRKNSILRNMPSNEETVIITDVCEKTARSVLENPLLMGSILKQFECFDIQRLRKVNRGIRKCVDIIKPNPRIEKYSISFNINIHWGEIDVNLCLESGDFRKNHYWNDKQNFCEIGKDAFHSQALPRCGFTRPPAVKSQRYLPSARGQLFPSFNYQTVGNEFDVDFQLRRLDYLRSVKSKLFPSFNFENLFLHDFEATLRHQTSCLEELLIAAESFITSSHTSEGFAKVCFEQISKKIGDILKRREHPLKVQKFSMGSRSQMEIMKILPSMDRHFLKIIELLRPVGQHNVIYAKNEEMPFEVDELSQTDQWKNAKQLISKHLTITTPIQDMNILHFSNLEVLVKTLSSQDVDYLRNNLLKSRTFQKYKISFRESTIDESLHMLIGEPYRNISDVKKVWYFRIRNTDYYIHIGLDTRDMKNQEGFLKPKVIIFTRVAEEDTPFFELPMNQLAIN